MPEEGGGRASGPREIQHDDSTTTISPATDGPSLDSATVVTIRLRVSSTLEDGSWPSAGAVLAAVSTRSGAVTLRRVAQASSGKQRLGAPG